MKFGIIRSSVNGNRALYFTFQSHSSLLYSTSPSKQGNNNNNNIKNPNLSSSLLRNYLVQSLGFSTQQSISISSAFLKRSNRSRVGDCQIIEIAKCVVEFFKQHGFENSHVRNLIIHEPRILVSNVDKTLTPKIHLLLDLGFSRNDLILAILKNPFILRHDLVPVIHAFRTVLGCDQNVVSVFKQSNWLNFSRAAKYLIPNVELLRSSYEMPCVKIRKCIVRAPKLFGVSTDVFRDRLIRVEEEFGIPRHSGMFFYGLHLVSSLSQKNIEDKYRIFESFGWTRTDVMKLIRRYPLCLSSSEARIRVTLDFLMNQLGYNPDYLVSHHGLFIYSIKKRLLPRHRVLEVLKEKEILRMDYALDAAARYNETMFLKKFVLPYEEIHRVYAREMGSKVGSLVKKAKNQS